MRAPVLAGLRLCHNQPTAGFCGQKGHPSARLFDPRARLAIKGELCSRFNPFRPMTTICCGLPVSDVKMAYSTGQGQRKNSHFRKIFRVDWELTDSIPGGMQLDTKNSRRGIMAFRGKLGVTLQLGGVARRLQPMGNTFGRRKMRRGTGAPRANPPFGHAAGPENGRPHCRWPACNRKPPELPAPTRARASSATQGFERMVPT